MNFGSLDRAQIIAFAARIGDRNPIHQDIQAAQAMGFEEIVAPGVLMIQYALTTFFGDFSTTRVQDFEISFKKPLFPGKQISTTLESARGSDSQPIAIIEVFGAAERLARCKITIGTPSDEVRSCANNITTITKCAGLVSAAVATEYPLARVRQINFQCQESGHDEKQVVSLGELRPVKHPLFWDKFFSVTKGTRPFIEGKCLLALPQ